MDENWELILVGGLGVNGNLLNIAFLLYFVWNFYSIFW